MDTSKTQAGMGMQLAGYLDFIGTRLDFISYCADGSGLVYMELIGAVGVCKAFTVCFREMCQEMSLRRNDSMAALQVSDKTAKDVPVTYVSYTNSLTGRVWLQDSRYVIAVPRRVVRDGKRNQQQLAVMHASMTKKSLTRDYLLGGAPSVPSPWFSVFLNTLTVPVHPAWHDTLWGLAVKDKLLTNVKVCLGTWCWQTAANKDWFEAILEWGKQGKLPTFAGGV